MIESALLNLQKFNGLLQAFMDLPEVEELLKAVEDEADGARYRVVSPDFQQEIIELEKVISENQEDTQALFDKLDDVQRLLALLKWQTLLSSISTGKKGHLKKLKDKVTMSNLQTVNDQKMVELGQLEPQISVVLLSNPEQTEAIE